MKTVDANIGLLPEHQQKDPIAHLQAWFNENIPSEEMIYKEAFKSQLIFIRDTFSRLFRKQIEVAEVISTHTSKSIKFPVYHIQLKEMSFIIRGNLYNYKLSIDSKIPLHLPTELFTDGDEQQILKCYCEGFEQEWIYEPYEKNKQRFTVEIPDSDEMLFAILLLIKLQIENSPFFAKLK